MRILLILSAILQILNPSPLPDTAEVLFTGNKTNADFPNSITFTTSISSPAMITNVELIYGTDERTCGDVQALVIPTFKPGKQVDASWEWDMRNSGALPPGAEIWWQWKIKDENGKETSSEKQTVTWLDAVHPWQIKQEDPIRLHYYNITEDQARDFLNTATDAVDRLEKDTGMQPTNLVDLFMYPNTNDMRDALLYEPGWTGGMAFSAYNKIVIGMESQDLNWTRRTEAHELTHVLVGDYTFTCFWTTPTWLEEGLAVYGEGSPDANTVSQFEQAKEEDNLLSFHVLSASFSEDSEKADISYSQSYYMVNYLLETYGREKINRLLKTLAKGETIDDSLKEVYGFDLTGFENEWRKANNLPPREETENSGTSGTPTEIPTMHPVGGKVEPAATTTSIPITPIPLETPAGKNQSSNVIWFILAGALVAGLVTFFLVRSTNRKKNLISSFVILILISSIVSVRPVQAANPSEDYPPVPTATPYSPPVQTDINVYTDPSIGVSLDIPSNAKIDTSKVSAVYHFKLVIGDNEVIGHLFSNPLREGESLKEVAHKVRSTEMEGLKDISHITDSMIRMDNGRPAWLTVSEAKTPEDQMPLRIRIVTVKGYTSVISFLLYSSTGNYDYYEEEINDLSTSLNVTAPVISGYSRDELLVLDGGETDNPAENDPATARSSGGFYLVFSGLVNYDASMNLTPDLAESWDVSDDGLVYTFHLSPKAVFHNMRPVTAADVVYSWERAADPATASDTVMTYMGDILGMRERHTGKADHISGLKIIDAHTLQVTLEKPVPYFLLKLTYPTSYIVDKENVEKGGKWYMTPNGTGPFRLARWLSRSEILYERFDPFYGKKPGIKAILVRLYQGTSLQLYEQGQIDVAGVSYNDLMRFTDPTEPLSKQLKSNVNMCTGYITVDVNQPPFDDVKGRQAFAMSLDKDRYVKVIDDGGSLKANGLYPPALPGFDKNFKGLEFNPAKARELIKSSKYGQGDFPDVILSRSDYGNSVSEGVAAMVQMWEENLGVHITVQNIDPDYYQEELDSGNHGQLITESWCADYPDPENFADVLFHSGNEMNRSHYANPKLDSLLEEARLEKDVTKRIDLYSEAEKIIVNDVPAIFLTHSKSYILVKPYVSGYFVAPMSIPVERFVHIDASQFKEE